MMLRETISVLVGCLALSDALDLKAAIPLPSHVDNSQRPGFPPIADQGTATSCTTFATTYYTLTHMTALVRSGKISQASEAFSPTWPYNLVNAGNPYDGPRSSLTYSLHADHGAVSWSESPFQANLRGSAYDTFFRAWDTNPAHWRNALNYRAAAHYVPVGSELIRTDYVQLSNVASDKGFLDARALLAAGYVLTFRTYIAGWQFTKIGNDSGTPADDSEAGKDAAWSVSGWDSSRLHAMTVVGYHDDLWIDVNGNQRIDAGEKGAFRIANSWGEGFRDRGFTWLAYDARFATSQVSGGPAGANRWPAFGTDGILQSVTAYKEISPQILFEVTLRHRFRDQIGIWLGAANTPVFDAPDFNSNNPSTAKVLVFYRLGGPFGFDGTPNESSATLVFDAFKVIEQLGRMGGVARRWFLGVADEPAQGLAEISRVTFRHPASGALQEMNVTERIDGTIRWFAFDFEYRSTNEAPQVTATIQPTQVLKPGQPIVLTCLANDPDGPVQRVRVFDAAGYAGDAVELVPGSHAWAYSIDRVEDRHHQIRFEAEDQSGKVGSAAVTLPLDLQAPPSTLRIVRWAIEKARLRLAWESETGRSYELQMKSSLENDAWVGIMRQTASTPFSEIDVDLPKLDSIALFRIALLPD